MTTFSVLALETVSTVNVVTGAISLTSNAEYALVNCDLGITARRTSALGGASPYTDVPVDLTVHVIGSTAALCAAAMDRLIAMVAQARRWVNRENVDGVRLRMRLQGGTSDYLCILLGPEDNEPPTSFAIEETAINSVNCFMVRDVTLRFVRRGLLTKTAAVTATSSATNLKEIGSCTFAASSAIPVPTAIQVTPSAGPMGSSPGYVVITALGRIRRLDAASGTVTSGSAASTVDTANRAVGGSVMRFTAPGAVVSVSLGLDITWRQVAVFATVRVNTAGGEWSIAARLGSTSVGSSDEGQPRVVTVQPLLNPQTVFLGFFSARLDFRTEIVITAIGNTGTMDINCIYIAGTDLPAYIIDARLGSQGFARDISYAGAIQPRDHYDRDPFVGSTIIPGGTDQTTYSYEGDVFITSEGTGLSFVMLDGGSGGFWRQGSGVTPSTDVVVATRYPGALTPQ